MDVRFRPLRAVFFVVLCAGLLAFTYLLVFRVDFGGSTSVTVRFSSVGTIQPGSPVRQSGVKIGTVSRVALAPDDRSKVDVDLSLYSGLVVREGDRVAIVTGGLLGDQYIDVAAGPSDGSVVPPGKPIAGQSGLDLKMLVDDGGTLLQDLSATSRTIARFLEGHEADLNRILAEAERGTSRAADAAERADRLLAKAEEAWDPAAADARAALKTLRETSLSLQGLVQSLQTPGSPAALLASPASGKSAAETLENLRSATASLKKVADTLEAALK